MEDEKEQWTINLILPRVNFQPILGNFPDSQLTIPKACSKFLCLVHMWTGHKFCVESQIIETGELEASDTGRTRGLSAQILGGTACLVSTIVNWPRPISLSLTTTSASLNNCETVLGCGCPLAFMEDKGSGFLPALIQ
jgi:hypothetical protein